MRRFLGIDPGPIPGLVLLLRHPGEGSGLFAQAFQCSQYGFAALLDTLLEDDVLVQAETFVDSSRSGRVANKSDLEVTRTELALIKATCAQQGSSFIQRRASDVKPWATDDRLAHAGLLEPTKGMRHARDAARHALFLACQNGVPDPLSKNF